MAVPRYLRRALQLGLEGLILPMAESAAQAPISGAIFGAVDLVMDHLPSGYLLHSNGIEALIEIDGLMFTYLLYQYLLYTLWLFVT